MLILIFELWSYGFTFVQFVSAYYEWDPRSQAKKFEYKDNGHINVRINIENQSFLLGVVRGVA